jgi:outer membrane protein TolC
VKLAIATCAVVAGVGCATVEESSLADVKPAAAFDVSKPMTLDDAGALAVAHNPDLVAARAALPVKDAEALRAAGWPDPSVTATMSQPVTDAHGDGIEVVVGVDWDVGDLITKGAAKRAALLAADAARLSLRYQELVVAGAARLEAAKVASLGKQRAIAVEAKDAADALVSAAESAREHGDATIDDVGVKQAAAAEAEAHALEIDGALAEAKLALTRAIGADPHAPVEVTGVIVAPEKSAADDDVEALFELACAQRADLVALRRAYEGQEQEMLAAVLGQFPKLALHGEGTQDHGKFLTAGGGFTVSIPVFDGNRGNIAIERATRDQLRAEYAARLFETKAAIADAVHAAHQARDARIALAARLPKLTQAEAEMKQALVEKNTTAVAYSEVHSAFLAAQLRALTLAEDEVEARLALQVAVGAPATTRNAP